MKKLKVIVNNGTTKVVDSSTNEEIAGLIKTSIKINDSDSTRVMALVLTEFDLDYQSKTEGA